VDKWEKYTAISSENSSLLGNDAMCIDKWLILIIKPVRCTNSQIYFWNRTLHVLDRFSVHHQESSKFENYCISLVLL